MLPYSTIHKFNLTSKLKILWIEKGNIGIVKKAQETRPGMSLEHMK